MKKILFIIIALTCFQLQANLHLAPPDFQTPDGKWVRFIDIQKADYQIFFDVQSKRAWARSIINFFQPKVGHAFFDLKVPVRKIWLNQNLIQAHKVSLPGHVSQGLITSIEIGPGNHQLVLEHDLKGGVRFTRNGVRAGFWILDLTDKNMLERYLPTNLEYDQYSMNFDVKVLKSKLNYRLMANGKVLGSKQTFTVSYPSHYTASSIFFHLYPIGHFKELLIDYQTLDKRTIPLIIYSKHQWKNRIYARRAIRIMKELEKDYGPWPHDFSLIYATKIKGGMDYPGATMTSLISLGDEMHHSYFAKSVMPANGNAGWIDEAIASFRDQGYRYHPNALIFSGSQMGGRSDYVRKTHKKAYTWGRSFIEHLHFLTFHQGGMIQFLKHWHEKRQNQVITSQIFQSDLEDYWGENCSALFNQYIYGKNRPNEQSLDDSGSLFCPHHLLTSKDLEQLI